LIDAAKPEGIDAGLLAYRVKEIIGESKVKMSNLVENLGDTVTVIANSIPIPGATLHRRTESEAQSDAMQAVPPNLFCGLLGINP